MNGLAGLVADVEFALQNDLHLMVGVGVNKGSASFESVNSAADGLLGVDLLAAGHVAEVSVFVGN